MAFDRVLAHRVRELCTGRVTNHVFLELVEQTDRSGRAPVNVRDLCNLSGWSQQAVRKALAELVALGVIERDQFGITWRTERLQALKAEMESK